LEQILRSQALPVSADAFDSLLFSSTDWLEKDAREILALSLQLHHIDVSGKVYINQGFAKQNGTTGGAGLNDPLVKAVFFAAKPHTTKIVPATDVYGVQNAAFNTSSNSIVILSPTNNTISAKPAWGYVKDLEDGTYEILFWVDESTATPAQAQQYYINFDSSY
jgi:hypothetical protein